MRKRLVPVSVTLVLSLSAAIPAHAQVHPDVEGTFVAGMFTPSAPHPFVGAGFGFSNPRFALEIEYAGTVGQSDTTPAAFSITVNLIVMTPLRAGRAQFYGLAGFGVYAESYQEGHGSGALQALNFGAGAKVPLNGPLSLRLEYRLFTGEREATDPRKGTGPPQRLSAGLSFGF
jgi:Outer membrane protein beta-barrel domain